MNLTEVHQGVKKYKKRKRIGRGTGSGHGKTSGRGHKGQGSRAGFSMHPTFEGGQMPLARRIPKRGFNNKRFRTEYAILNVQDLEKYFEADAEVSLEAAKGLGISKKRDALLKILGKGEINKKLTVSAHKFSATAREKIEAAGGTVVELSE